MLLKKKSQMRFTRLHVVVLICVVIAVIALAVGLGVGFGMKPEAMYASEAKSTLQLLREQRQRQAAFAKARRERQAEALRNKRVMVPPVDEPKPASSTPLKRGDFNIFETNIGHRYIVRDNSFCRMALAIELVGATVSTTLDDALNMAWNQNMRNSSNPIAGVYRDKSGMWRGCALPSSNGDATWPAQENGQPPMRIYEFESHLLDRKVRFNQNGYTADINKMRKINGEPRNIDGTSYLYDDLQGEIAKELKRQRNQPQPEIA